MRRLSSLKIWVDLPDGGRDEISLGRKGFCELFLVIIQQSLIRHDDQLFVQSQDFQDGPRTLRGSSENEVDHEPDKPAWLMMRSAARYSSLKLGLNDQTITSTP